jgi:hypothetical protein
MEYFEHNFPLEKAVKKDNPRKWVLDRALRLRNKKQIEAFSLSEYLENPSKHVFFKQIVSEFVCANPDCKSTNVKCTWYHYNGIDVGVDETFGEFYCANCGKYTFVEYYRDSS